ncbi:MAG: hypothetical protein HY692_05805 [Cyanobacteria bacterium NC_groundwater_1444_Ag_S-0.65um_54_12]|nr:hypothetical protein [Cyanobacteria bacterium NC_groundwater_1444_Ag_S-0.65um_54_12]
MLRLRGIIAGFLLLNLASCRGAGVDLRQSSTLLAYLTQFNSNTVVVVDTVTKTPVGEPIKVGTGPVRMVASPPNVQSAELKDRLYVLDQTGGTVSFVNRRSRNNEADVTAGQQPSDLAITANGQYLFVTSPSEQTVTRIRIGTRNADAIYSYRNAQRVGNGFRPSGIAIHPTKKEIYVVSDSLVMQPGANSSASIGMVSVLTYSEKELSEVNAYALIGAVQPFRAVVDRQGSNLVVTDLGKTNGLHVVDLASGTPKSLQAGVGAGTYGAVISPEGVIYATVPNKNVYIQILPGPSPLATPWDSGGSQPKPLAISNDGGELWIGNVGSSKVVFARLRGLEKPFDIQAVQYSLQPSLAQPPGDILLAGGVR